ncbi:hypothetical protein BDW02DRAFT_290193 [Decorospora gaudefroyi]|uniref:F-box domain-containing protein n=1 Tax=Decorospora gaudefroyi TaxID=184978 RepID=A0A6A5KBP0_9PLEO|nr:hypothetical protein BDW02DRAFT_290193 [Decorospora gaudefroyi]
MNTIPTTLGPESVPSSAFLSLPAEIRNHIYRCLLPDVTNLRDTAGLVCACKQIRQELTSMIVAETMPVIQAVQQQSMAFYKSTYATSMARSFVSVPAVKNHSQLCNVNFSISIGNGMSHHPSGVRYPAFTTVFGGLKSLLSLHLPYVTISVPVILQEDETLGDPLLRERFLGTCYTAFKMVEADPNCNINAHHVIFEVGKEKWEGHEFVHPPVIAFVRQASKKGKVGYEVLGYDPAAEIDDEIGRAIETDESMIERLRLILKKSRDAARDGN